MSDYYGDATLESWLSEEIFVGKEVNKEVVSKFEKWRESVENSINSWMESDDGDGNNLSWRGWGRGFSGIPESDDIELGIAIKFGMSCINAK